MPKFSSIHIIYNPKSTGPGKQMATDTHKKLQQLYKNMPVNLVATKYAGHAEELTFTLASKEKTPLIISVSGDGGYNEVINGAVKAYEARYHPITSILPAGNANDHHTSIGADDIIKEIKAQNVKTIDLLSLKSTAGKRTIHRYAHSYIGFGVTPTVGKKLTATKLNFLNEALIVVKGILRPRLVRLSVNGKTSDFDSITVSNIDRMAKVLTLGKQSKVDDGLFELNIVKHAGAFSLLSFMLKASTVGISDNQRARRFEVTTVEPTLVQLDGEVLQLPARSQVQISIAEYQLHYI